MFLSSSTGCSAMLSPTLRKRVGTTNLPRKVAGTTKQRKGVGTTKPAVEVLMTNTAFSAISSHLSLATFLLKFFSSLLDKGLELRRASDEKQMDLRASCSRWLWRPSTCGLEDEGLDSNSRHCAQPVHKFPLRSFL